MEQNNHLNIELGCENNKKATIFIECTHTYHSDLNTGIQRVVRNILRTAAPAAERHGYTLVPVIVEGDRLVPADLAAVLVDKRRRAETVAEAVAVVDPTQPPQPPIAPTWTGRAAGGLRPGYRLLLRLLALIFCFSAAHRFIYASADTFGLTGCLLAPWRLIRNLWTGQSRPLFRPAPGTNLDPGTDSNSGIDLDHYEHHDGNILLLLDASWHLPVWSSVQRFKKAGGHVACVVYDLIPVTHPHGCVKAHIADFAKWSRSVIEHADLIIGISRSVQEQIETFFGTGGRLYRNDIPIPVSYFYLGSELDFVTSTSAPREAILTIFSQETHIFLVVGSIEPRKNHGYILDAFERFWSAGGTGTLVIIGREGWMAEGFIARTKSHPMLGTQLFVQRDMTDDDLDFSYRNASALVIASEVEGFGLPIVESFQRGLPVLCSDIPVFREIADGKAAFFALESPQHLADALTAFCQRCGPDTRYQRTPQPWLTWRQSAEQLIDTVVAHTDLTRTKTI